MSIDNQSFQSLLQLAVALNIGFAAISTFFGNTLSKEKEKVELLFETSRSIRELTKELRDGLEDSDREGFREVAELRNDVTRAEARYDRLFSGVARWIALACALGSFGALVVASLYGKDSDGWVGWAAIVANVPLLGFIAYATYISLTVINPLRDRRYGLDDRMSRKLGALTVKG